VRPPVPSLLLAALLGLALLSGCSGEDKPEPASGPGLPSQADLKSYFEAITGSDADELARAQSDIAADGSLAQGYAAYVGEFAAAAAAAGEPGDPADVEEVDGGFKACVGNTSGQCATWSNLVGKDGKLADFTINGTKLDDLLVDLTNQPPVESAGLYQVQPDWAYLQPKSGMLFVVCTVTATDIPLSPKPGVYIEEDRILKGVEAPSPAAIEAGTSSPVILAFADAQEAKLDGQITFDLQLGDQETESIGFGLTDPAA
jgi:hypothetical protein